MKTLLGRKTLPAVSLSAILALGAAGCDEGSDDEVPSSSGSGGSKASAGSSGSSSSDGGKGGSTSSSSGGSKAEGGSGGSTSSGSGGSKAAGGSGGSASSGAACDPTKKEVKVSENISKDTTWECGTYLLESLVFVTDNSTLTIAPGSLVLGDTDVQGKVKGLIIARGSKLNAVGTKDAPIVFTSGNAAGDRAGGDWGGVVLLGAATVNKGNCVDGSGDSCQGGYFQGNVEGLSADDKNALYGGKDDKHNCGELKYVRIEYAGYQLSPENELNGLTVGACGTDTKLSYIQVHRGSDDAIEFFGGTAGMDHVVLSGMSDDGLDWDLGWRGKAQFVVIHQSANDGDKGIEADNQGENEVAEPRSAPELYNFTMIGNPAKTGMLLREGTRATVRNFIVQDFAVGVDIAAKLSKPADEWPSKLSVENSVFSNVEEAGDPDPDSMGMSGDDDMGFADSDMVKDAARKNTFDVDPKLGSIDIEKPNYKPANKDIGGKATPSGDFDAKATYAGAVDPDGDDWTAGWTDFSKN